MTLFKLPDFSKYKIVYGRPNKMTYRDVLSGIWQANGNEKESEEFFEYLHFKLLKSWEYESIFTLQYKWGRVLS